MAIEPQDPNHDRERLEEIIGLCAKRRARAVAKLESAQAEHTAAVAALDAARQRLAVWIIDNPDPQRSIFEEISDV